MNASNTQLILVMPPQFGLLSGFAAGLISLANFIEARMSSVRVKILDLSDSSPDATMAALAACVPTDGARTFVGVTTTTATYQAALQVARVARGVLPGAVIVFGGHHASADAETVLRHHPELVDVIVVGEGEYALCELLAAYPQIQSVPGVSYGTEDGSIVRNRAPSPLSQSELDAIPVTHANSLIGTPGKFDHVTYVSARGCPYNCGFCAVGRNPIRAKSAMAVKRDVRALVSLGYSRIAIEDNFFAHSAARTQEICAVLADLRRETDHGFTWDCQTRVEALCRPGTISLMASAGCEAVYVGVESVHCSQLLYMKKTDSPAEYLRALADIVVPQLLGSPVACYLNIQFGLPGETEKELRETVEVLSGLGRLALREHRKITVFPQLHVVYPGTDHFSQGVADGRFAPDVFEAFTEWEGRVEPILYWLGDHFAHGTGGIPEGIMRQPLLDQGQFEVDGLAVFRILDALRVLGECPGIEVFNYRSYITNTRRSQSILLSPSDTDSVAP